MPNPPAQTCQVLIDGQQCCPNLCRTHLLLQTIPKLDVFPIANTRRFWHQDNSGQERFAYFPASDEQADNVVR